ncbi:MAG: hypothetical protein JRJ12_03485 [Deltaproteobacteria bacterium]|nr:hypothetical protein [Deltaproteobacteria bacterium]MBW2070292.1 hypothetical protein [Deltaproteobacteria bacterium]
MLRSFAEVKPLISGLPPKVVAVVSPRNHQVMLALRDACNEGTVIPTFIGSQKTIYETSEKSGFNIRDFLVIDEDDPQDMADIGVGFLDDGRADFFLKGQIPTSHIFKAVIKNQARATTRKRFSVVTLWEMPGLNRLIAITDPGVNIKPDLDDKIEIVRNAVSLMHLLGYSRPTVLLLSAHRGMSMDLSSRSDAEKIRQAVRKGMLEGCRVVSDFSLFDLSLKAKADFDYQNGVEQPQFPDIFLVPNLEAGNILVKMDYIIKLTRRSVMLGASGPLLLPSRSDTYDSIKGEIEFGVLISHWLRGGTSEKL